MYHYCFFLGFYLSYLSLSLVGIEGEKSNRFHTFVLLVSPFPVDDSSVGFGIRKTVVVVLTPNPIRSPNIMWASTNEMDSEL